MSNAKNIETMRTLVQSGPIYGPYTKEQAKYLFAFYSDALVLGSGDKTLTLKMMAFYKGYIY